MNFDTHQGVNPLCGLFDFVYDTQWRPVMLELEALHPCLAVTQPPSSGCWFTAAYEHTVCFITVDVALLSPNTGSL